MAQFAEDRMYTMSASSHMSTDTVYIINNDQWSHYPKDEEPHSRWCVLVQTFESEFVVGTDLATERDAFSLAASDASAHGLEFDPIDEKRLLAKLAR